MRLFFLMSLALIPPCICSVTSINSQNIPIAPEPASDDSFNGLTRRQFSRSSARISGDSRLMVQTNSLPSYYDEESSPDYEHGMLDLPDSPPLYPIRELKEVIRLVEEQEPLLGPMGIMLRTRSDEVLDWCDKHHPPVPEHAGFEQDALIRPRHPPALFAPLCKYSRDVQGASHKDRYLLMQLTARRLSYCMIMHVLSPPVPIGKKKSADIDADSAKLVDQLTNIQIQKHFPGLFLERQAQLFQKFADKLRRNENINQDLLNLPPWKTLRSRHKTGMDILLMLPNSKYPKRESKTLEDGEDMRLKDWYDRWAKSLNHLHDIYKEIAGPNGAVKRSWVSGYVEKIKEQGKLWRTSFFEQYGRFKGSFSLKKMLSPTYSKGIRRLKESLISLAAPLTEALLISIRPHVRMLRTSKLAKVKDHWSVLGLTSLTSEGKAKQKLFNVLIASVWKDITRHSVPLYPTEANFHHFNSIRRHKQWSSDVVALGFESDLISHAISEFKDELPADGHISVRKVIYRLATKVGAHFPLSERPFSALQTLAFVRLNALAAHLNSGSFTQSSLKDDAVEWIKVCLELITQVSRKKKAPSIDLRMPLSPSAENGDDPEVKEYKQYLAAENRYFVCSDKGKEKLGLVQRSIARSLTGRELDLGKSNIQALISLLDVEGHVVLYGLLGEGIDDTVWPLERWIRLHTSDQPWVMSLLTVAVSPDSLSSWTLEDWQRARGWTRALEACLRNLNEEGLQRLQGAWETQSKDRPAVTWDELCQPGDSLYRRALGHPGVSDEVVRGILFSGAEQETLAIFSQCTEMAARTQILQGIDGMMRMTIEAHLKEEASLILESREPSRIMDLLPLYVAMQDAGWMGNGPLCQDLATSQILLDHFLGQRDLSRSLQSLSQYVQVVPRGMALLLLTMHTLSMGSDSSLPSYKKIIQPLYQMLQGYGDGIITNLLLLPPTMALELGAKFPDLGSRLTYRIVQVTQRSLLDESPSSLSYNLEDYWKRILIQWTIYREHLEAHVQLLMALSLLDRSIQPPPLLLILLALAVHRMQSSTLGT
ncbi:hypothetical protein BJ684DRAFT_14850 [Piptocephalis cylindrospora]|uniref:Uncharacterized protein n=1 Tax=Piptocephalis cylindrospora TaxID=1907219 RepID=A0A4P9Y727_9FUNG|nr:hypothetical protein BJ684DRAFT_14850 [Piptocephalis cylindrospora]|eukprot:RKP14855.1 hypothetical protein BJ684DRAFT_14850 [Piptocephalis cylindrospora]